MELIKTEKHTERQYDDMKDLVDICSRNDGTLPVLDIDESFKAPDDINLFFLYRGEELISFISLFAPGRKEAEVSAFTHPEHRRQGLFTQLLSAAAEELNTRGTEDFLFVSDRESADGLATIKALGAVYEYSEFSMQLAGNPVQRKSPSGITIRKATQDDTPRLIELSMLSFGESAGEAENYIKKIFNSDNRSLHVAESDGRIAGMVSSAAEDGKSYIHGLCVLPSARGRGIGGALLDFKVLETLKLSPDKKIELEVMTNNSGALSIYDKSGFKIAACYDYYRKRIKG